MHDNPYYNCGHEHLLFPPADDDAQLVSAYRVDHRVAENDSGEDAVDEYDMRAATIVALQRQLDDMRRTLRFADRHQVALGAEELDGVSEAGDSTGRSA